MEGAGMERILESSCRDNGTNASTIAAKTRLTLPHTVSSRTSENACNSTWEYRESMPVRPSCVVPLPLDRTSWRRSFGSWCSDATNLTKVEAKMNSPDDFSVSALISLS
jgi:hypothetical protein